MMDKVMSNVIKCAGEGATLVVLQELPLTPYFCQTQNPLYLTELPMPTLGSSPSSPSSNKLHEWLSELSESYNISIGFSYYERSNGNLYNTFAIYSPSLPPTQYRKTHIPDGPGYCEKFYFTPGDTGPVVAELPCGLRVGLSVCWDQWFPEQARCLAVMGAHVLVYPTAIGSEPSEGICGSGSSKEHWRRVMQGHSASNMLPVMAVNRTGVEKVEDGNIKSEITFYGSSFGTDNTGKLMDELREEEEGIVSITVDIQQIERERITWGMWRDRRPECYGAIRTKDGTRTVPGA